VRSATGPVAGADRYAVLVQERGAGAIVAATYL
jgi:hypothetical protein